MPEVARPERHPVQPMLPMSRWITPVIREMCTWPTFEPAPVGNHRHTACVSALCRFYDDADLLLYIGVTTNPSRRWNAHTHADWWRLARSVSIEAVPPRERLQREWDAIRAERPRFNRTGLWRRPGAHTPGSAE